MHEQVLALAREAESQNDGTTWVLGAEDEVLAAEVAAGLVEAVGPAARQEALPVIERLGHLREVLAVLALATARTHGHLAWFLARASTALAPVLHWRALTATPGHSFGAVLPEPDELHDAEHAVRFLAGFLTRTGATDAPDGRRTDSPSSSSPSGNDSSPEGLSRPTALPPDPSPKPVLGHGEG
ncbi:hypothetical protein [Streptomyces sp. NPDC097619]|uniref:hypothetical protein n=1 Tax=Streptomyces sp. NPDC097619 TaxID=3157228 RepID=UPI003331CB53